MKNYERLKDLREDKDMKQWQVAEILKMKQEQYQRYESGQTKTPLQVMIDLAEYYNVSMDYITGISNDKGGRHYKYKDEDEKEIMELWQQLDQDEKNEIKNNIEYKLKIKKIKKEKKSAI